MTSSPPLLEGENLKKMHLYAHLKELRKRLLWSALSIIAMFGVGFWQAEPVYQFLLRPLAAAMPASSGNTMIFTAVTDGFMTQMRVAWFSALVLAFPLYAYQLYAFVVPGLYSAERRWFVAYIAAAPLLFTAGCALAYYGVLKLAFEFFLSFEMAPSPDAQSLGSQYLGSISQYLSFVTGLLLAFGLSFQLPVVLTVLGRAGIVSAATLRKYRRHTVVLTLIFAGVVTPPDALSQLSLSVPLYLLFELSILLISLKKPTVTQSETAPQPQPGH
ncbi:MAG: twin-arginine translocase subunit TatC [Holosporales bacterium]|jgi:sec-independent protein translocase protein TatC